MNTETDTNRINLAGRLTVWGAEDLKCDLLEALEAGGNIALDLAPNDEIDTAGFQVLSAAFKSAVNRSVSLILPASLPEYIVEWLGQAGLDTADITGEEKHE